MAGSREGYDTPDVWPSGLLRVAPRPDGNRGAQGAVWLQLARWGLAVIALLAAALVPWQIASRGPGGSHDAGVPAGTGAFQSGEQVTPSPAQSPLPTPTELPPYIERLQFDSAALGRPMDYYVYLPPSYDSVPQQRFPVLYMLHGMGAANNEWLDYGLFGRARDVMLAGQVAQFLIVLPRGDDGYWVDHPNGGPAWGTYVARDLVNEIDTRFRTIPGRGSRAVGGNSMGGYGALELAMLFPDVFGVVGAHSPSLHNFATAPPIFGDQTYFDAHDPMRLYPEHAELASTVKLWLDAGVEDGWYGPIYAFNEALNASRIPHEWHAYEGLHQNEYWSTHIVDYLVFYGGALTNPDFPQSVPWATPTPAPAAPAIGAGTANTGARPAAR